MIATKRKAAGGSSPSEDDGLRLQQERLRCERDRFLAFAFAAGSVLLEVSADGRILFSTGAIRTLTGAAPEKLVGRHLVDLLDPSDSGAMALALERLQDLERLLPLGVKLQGPGEEPCPMIVTGCRLPQSTGVVHLSLRPAAPGEAVPSRDAETGLLDPSGFEKEVRDRLLSSSGSNLTFVELQGLDELCAHLDAATAERLPQRLGGLLLDAADDGVAGRVARERFGLLHDAELNVSRLEQELLEVLRDVDPTGSGVATTSTSIPLVTDGLDEVDAGKAVRFAIKQFAARPCAELDVRSLRDGFDAMLQATIGEIASFRETLTTDRLGLVFQPIVRLATTTISHYEALSRNRDGAAPARLLDFAEAIDLVGEFDLLVCRRVLDILATTSRRVSIGVNLSARSLEDAVFVQALTRMLDGAEDVRRRLLFEITETAEVKDFDRVDRAVGALRGRRCRVGLDDFGAGAMAFHYLRRLKVDFVKLDGGLVRSTDHRDRAVLKSVVQLCRDLHVLTVAEMIETREQAGWLRGLKVDMGQGFLFGRPSPDL